MDAGVCGSPQETWGLTFVKLFLHWVVKWVNVGWMVGSLATVSARAWCGARRLILICCLIPEMFWSELAGMRVIQF